MQTLNELNESLVNIKCNIEQDQNELKNLKAKLWLIPSLIWISAAAESDPLK